MIIEKQKDINTEECEKCNGAGYIFSSSNIIWRCEICHGVGKLDWVEKVTKSFKGRSPDIRELVKKWEKDHNRTFWIINCSDFWALGVSLLWKT